MVQGAEQNGSSQSDGKDTAEGSEILCVGEVLWDSLPTGLFLGGAPFNVAGHLNALGVPATLVSRVGSDRLGREAIERIAASDMGTDLVQRDPSLETGFVSVTMAGEGIPSYDVVAPVAWDRIELEEALLVRAERAAAIVFGSLAQRSPVSRHTIEQLYEIASFRVFDVNLRPPHQDPEVVRNALRHADLVKLNEIELRQLAEWFGLPRGIRESITALADRFGCPTVCVTRGPLGAVLLREGRWSEHSGYHVAVRDTVGSGDAFLAAVLAGVWIGRDDERVLQRANLLGAYVATQSGAIPVYREEVLKRILEKNGQQGSAIAKVAVSAVGHPSGGFGPRRA